MLIHDLFEARKPAIPVTPFNAASTLSRLKAVAEKLARRPFDLDWDYQDGNALKAKVASVIAQHQESFDDDEEQTPLNEGDLYLDFVGDAWKALTARTFSAVEREIRRDTIAYQTRHGERLDQETGHATDMNFIESSDWLNAMDFQSRMGKSIYYAGIDTPNDIVAVTVLFERFVAEWPTIIQTDQRDEPTLSEAMMAGLSAAIPLLLLVAKKAV